MMKTMLRLLIAVFFIFLMQPSFAQLNCDTLFLKGGDTILINSNHSESRQVFRYQECKDSIWNNWQSIKIKNVLRISNNDMLLNIEKKAKHKLNAQVFLVDDTRIHGTFLGFNESSIVVLKEKRFLQEYFVKDLDKVKLGNNKRVTAFVLTGILVGGGIGLGLTKDGVSWKRALTLLSSGIISGGILGGFIGGAKIRININRNQDQFDSEIKKVKF